MNEIMSLFVAPSTSSLAFRILSMDERLRVGKVGHSFEASTGYQVRSWNYPEITDNAVYIRGDQVIRDDDFVTGYPFTTTPSELMLLIVKSIKEYIEKTLGIIVYLNLHQNGYISFIEYDMYTPLSSKE